MEDLVSQGSKVHVVTKVKLVSLDYPMPQSSQDQKETRGILVHLVKVDEMVKMAFLVLKEKSDLVAPLETKVILVPLVLGAPLVLQVPKATMDSKESQGMLGKLDPKENLVSLDRLERVELVGIMERKELKVQRVIQVYQVLE